MWFTKFLVFIVGIIILYIIIYKVILPLLFSKRRASLKDKSEKVDELLIDIEDVIDETEDQAKEKVDEAKEARQILSDTKKKKEIIKQLKEK